MSSLHTAVSADETVGPNLEQIRMLYQKTSKDTQLGKLALDAFVKQEAVAATKDMPNEFLIDMALKLKGERKQSGSKLGQQHVYGSALKGVERHLVREKEKGTLTKEKGRGIMSRGLQMRRHERLHRSCHHRRR